MSTATPPTPYVLVQLQSGEPEYENILQEFVKDNIKVTKIERLENTRLSDSFKSEQDEMTNHTPDFNLNIRRLYHCTCIEKSTICEEGIGQTMSSAGDFGIGFYFSDSPIKCLHYSEFANHPERAVILRCLVILGDSTGSQSGFNQYVVHENRLVKVEYIITIAVNEETIESMRSIQAGQTSKASISKAWKYVAVGLGVGVVGFIATPLIVVGALGTVGFTAGGVAAGSVAAAVQATIGNVAAGSAFAMAQSAAATGVVSVGTQLAGGTIFGAASAAVMKLFKRKTHRQMCHKKND
ncbi:hypothetical protein ACJMK2_023720 [Sinanodonta woodiana]|uniref:PARP catalytic domain-containing protein n=1 Tax=Sinanodonta woodiana TaxID=1069815 RepID=A0ABD3T555_SINWO